MQYKAPDAHAALGLTAGPANSLTDVLGRNEAVKGLVVEAAGELAAINTEIKHELMVLRPVPGLESAVEKSEAVGVKVHDASEKLASVNAALQEAVTDRFILDDHVAVITEQSAAYRYATLHDVLTGLPNRALFYDRVEHGIAHAKRHGWPLAVMFVDLDDFKTINDTHGHDAGDSVLRTVATRLQAATRSDDTVSRFGGDEFLYLLMEVKDEDAAASIAKKILAAIGTPCDLSTERQHLHLAVTASVGIAIYPKAGATTEALIKSADTAMYEAKRTGSGYAFAR